MGLIAGGGLLGVYLFLSLSLDRRHWPRMDTGTQIALIALGPIVGALTIVLMRWVDADAVVEFACDGRSFRFRKVGRERAETRDLPEIAKVLRGTGRGQLRYVVVFRDGAQAELWRDALPNAEVFAEWLRSGGEGA